MYIKKKVIQSLADVGSLLEVAFKPSGSVHLQRALWPLTVALHELCKDA